MIHRDVFKQVGSFNESLPACEDYDLWLKITARFQVLFIDQPLVVKYGGHDDQLSTKYWGMDRFRIQALENILAEVSLSQQDRCAAIAMLKRKAKIVSQGALKRGKQQEALYYQQIMKNSYD
jgi:hypothetical protein